MKWIVCACLVAVVASGARAEREEAAAASVEEVRARLLSLESALWKRVSSGSNEVTAQGEDVELMRAFRTLDEEVVAVERYAVPAELSWLWVKMRGVLSRVDSLYAAFDEFASRQLAGHVPAPVHEWLALADLVLADTDKSVVKAFDEIEQLMLHGDIFRSVLKDSHPDLCNLQQSPQQLLYNLYSTISLTEIKGYAMMQFSWMLLRIYGKGNFTQEATMMRQRYEERTSRTITTIRSVMMNTTREMYRCDPIQHEEGETYLQITRFLQGYIENEVDMNSDGSCSENCAFYTLAQNHGCFKEQFCARQPPCTGRIINCQYVDSDMWICPATSKSNRRYEWIEYENGRTLGRPDTCARGSTKVDSWWRWLFWHCSYCMCVCDEPSRRSDRFFSLRDVTSDARANKVVTGLRFVKKGRMIHLQISESALGPRASVDGAARWVPVEEVGVDDRGLGVDYHALSYEERAMDLDELEGVQGHLLTGVRFHMIGAHLHFEIQVTPFNYTSGQLDAEKSRWISNENTEGTEKPRRKLNLDKPDVPTRALSPSHVDSAHDQYVEFTHTDLDADAAQTTVPFIDAQPLQPSAPVPLTGAGLAHRGQRGSGGFITPKIYTYDYAPHMHARTPTDSPYSVQNNPDFVPGVY